MLAYLNFFLLLDISKFIFLGKVLGKAFRIVGLDERKVKWVVKQDFDGNFQVNVTCFLPFFPLSSTQLCPCWGGLKDLFSLHKLVNKVVLDC